MDAAPQLPVAADWFSLTWVTGRTAVLTEPHVDELLRAGLWYLRGRDRDLLVDTGNGVAALAPVLARLARSGRPREIVCLCTHAHIDHIGGFHEFERRLLHPAEEELATHVRNGAPLAPAMWSRGDPGPARRERVRAAAGARRRHPLPRLRPADLPSRPRRPDALRARAATRSTSATGASPWSTCRGTRRAASG